jgi:regulation of enolase protein 1 (concanavalin A-like superfamily)
MMRHDFAAEGIPDGFSWLNEPQAFRFERGLAVTTKGGTDFWQATHYGFRRDDGHCLLTARSGDFSLETRAEFSPRTRYDQCGIMVRVDEQNWIKSSVEFEDAQLSRLGSVVTSLGFSDWATQDISSGVRSLHHRISRRGSDFLIEWSADGAGWRQMRIAHLHALAPGEAAQVGVYACSPLGDRFECRFAYIDIDENRWLAPDP